MVKYSLQVGSCNWAAAGRLGASEEVLGAALAVQVGRYLEEIQVLVILCVLTNVLLVVCLDQVYSGPYLALEALSPL